MTAFRPAGIARRSGRFHRGGCPCAAWLSAWLWPPRSQRVFARPRRARHSPESTVQWRPGHAPRTGGIGCGSSRAAGRANFRPSCSEGIVLVDKRFARRWVRGHLFPLADPAYRLSDREDRRGQAHRLRRPLRPGALALLYPEAPSCHQRPVHGRCGAIGGQSRKRKEGSKLSQVYWLTGSEITA